jgi:hypothetical protein
MRFFVRRAPVGWMVWDREIGGPARLVNGRIASKLSEDDARLICSMYSNTMDDSGDDQPPIIYKR